MNSAATLVRAVLAELDAAGAGLRCNDLIAKLRTLGFDVRDGRKPGHKVLTHPGLPAFTSSSFTCGHGRNPEIKQVYVRNVAAVVRNHEAALSEYLSVEHY